MSTSERPVAYSYIRFSSTGQADGDSVRRQTENAAAYAKANGLDLNTSLTFRDLAISGLHQKNATEGELGVFLEAVRSGTVIKPGSYLLVEAHDRLSRAGPSDYIPLLMQITNAGISIAFIAKDKVISREILRKNPFVFYEILTDAILANQESTQKSTRVGSAWAQKRKVATQSRKPMTAMCPEWLDIEKVGGTTERKFRVIKERKLIVRRIFKMTLAKQGKRLIARKFNEEGIPTWAVWKTEKEGEPPRVGKLRGDGWHDSYIQKILNNEAVRGIYQPHRRDPITKKRFPDGEPIEGYFPKIISSRLWKRTRRDIGMPPGPRSKRISNLFSGILFDGMTGASMRFVDKGCRCDGKLRDWKYLVSDISRTSPKTKAQTWPYTRFENWALKFLKELDWASLANPGTEHPSTRLRNRQIELERAIGTLTAQLDQMLTAFMDSPPALQAAAKTKAGKVATELAAKEVDLKVIQSELTQIEDWDASTTQSIDEFRELITSGAATFENRLALQAEIRRRVTRIDLYRHGHPVMAENSVGWPGVTIHFRNGSKKISMISKLSPDAVHTSRTQPRNDKTGAFIKSE